MFDYDLLYPVILVKIFPDPILRRQCELILDRYGSEAYHHEPSRVRLAILKLAGCDLKAIQKNVGYALIDYRDVLAWAEYPQAIRNNSWRLPDDSPEKRQLDRADLGQYQKWLDDILVEDGGTHGSED